MAKSNIRTEAFCESRRLSPKQGGIACVEYDAPRQQCEAGGKFNIPRTTGQRPSLHLQQWLREEGQGQKGSTDIQNCSGSFSLNATASLPRRKEWNHCSTFKCQSIDDQNIFMEKKFNTHFQRHLITSSIGDADVVFTETS